MRIKRIVLEYHCNIPVFGGKIILEVNNSVLLEDVPGSEPSRLKITIKRKDRSSGAAFAKKVAQDISEYKLNHPDAELSDDDISTLLN